MIRRSIPIAFAILVLAFAGCSRNDKDKAAALANFGPPAIGKPAIDFYYNDIDEKPYRLTEDKGKVVILYFWKMKCKECETSMGSLDQLNRKYKGNGLSVITVGADDVHTAPIYEVDRFMKKNGYSFRLIRDDEGVVSEAYDVLTAPSAFIIDRKGVLVAIKNGPEDWMSAENIKMVESLINQAP